MSVFIIDIDDMLFQKKVLPSTYLIKNVMLSSY